MERRKLFSTPLRRRLFGDIAECGENPMPVSTEYKPKGYTTGRILVCQDCGFQMEDPGTGSTREYCPQCGSARFNYLETMPDYGKPGSLCPKKNLSAGYEEEDSEVEKEFSRIHNSKRRSLFSNTEVKKRRSLFSALTHKQPNNTGEGTDNGATRETVFKCTDCDHEFTMKNDVVSGKERCPNCGGNRVVKISQDSYSDSTDNTSEFLKKASGKSFSQNDAQKLFSECGVNGTLQDLVDSGYAHVNDNNEVTFSETADSEYSLFSNLAILVRKEFDLIPIPTMESKEDLIHSLEGGSMPQKSIILIKKAHGILPHQSDIVENEPVISDSYLKDSGIENDLKIEHGGETLTLPKFMEILDTRYNDAPENLIDQLTHKGIVEISGNRVSVK